MKEYDLQGILIRVITYPFWAYCRRRCWIVGLLLIFGSAAVDADLSARLERDQIAEGETVRLLVEAEGQVNGRPDTSALRQDFDVLGLSSGSQVNIVNGRMDARTTWTITLSPKRTGALTIPPLTVDGEQSPQLTLQVSEPAAVTDGSGGSPLFIESEIDPRNPYVQGMVRYKVRLFIGTRLAEGNLSDPQPDNALVRRLGEDRKFTQERDGQRYQVIEREYAVFPQASGELTLSAPVLDARVVERSAARRSPFKDFFGRDPFDDMFSATRQVRVRGESITVNVRPRPNQASGVHWLPAEHVELTEDWQPKAGEIHVGEPLTRAVTLRARGVPGEQLPELAPASAEGFKVYPDRPQTATRDQTQSVAGEKVLSMAFVPVRSGSFTLPAIRLHWWDTQSDSERVAELPERTIEVLPTVKPQGVSPQSEAVPQQSVDHEPLPSTNVELNASANSSIADSEETGSDHWSWISAVFALLWFGTLLMWWRDRKRREYAGGETVKNGRTNKQSSGHLKKRFLAACAANDPHAARRALLDWAGSHWPDNPPLGLGELAQRLEDQTAQAALAELDRVMYRDSGATWSGASLAKALTRLPRRRQASKEARLLPELYG